MEKEFGIDLPEGLEIKGTVPEGGSVSEVLNEAMAENSTVTVINPDGSQIEHFDADLVHPGDTIFQSPTGEIFVLKEHTCLPHIETHQGQLLLVCLEQY